MPRVWVLSPFSQPSVPPGFDRYAHVCQALTDRGAQVTQFISAFDHARKEHRGPPDVPWRVATVFEPGYRRNVSARRILSHLTFDLLVGPCLVREVLRSGSPDAVLAALPHNGAASIAGVLSKLLRAKFIVDVHDTWPESMISVARLNVMTRAGYTVWKATADVAYLLADEAFAESRRYAQRADEVRLPRGHLPARAIYLGGDTAYYAAIPPVGQLPPELSGATFLVAYAGNLGENYDLDVAFDAVAELGRDVSGVGLMLLGTGERESALRERALRLGVRAWFSGRLPHESLVAHLKRCHVGLNCFKPDGNVAYSYKLNDYLLAGVPVVNSLKGEAAALVADNDLGASYVAGSVPSMLTALRTCRERWDRDPSWSDRIRAFSVALLNRSTIYAPMFECCLGTAPRVPGRWALRERVAPWHRRAYRSVPLHRRRW